MKYKNIGGTKINCPPNPKKKEVGINRKIVHPLQNKRRLEWRRGIAIF
jgi:hypothetical protein